MLDHEDRRQPSLEIKEINERLDRGEQRMRLLEQDLMRNTLATQTIADNTQGLVTLTKDLEAGTKFLCRLAYGIKFMGELIKDTYIPVCILFVVFSAILHKDLPEWTHAMFKFFGE